MDVVVIGSGLSGKAAKTYLEKRGDRVLDETQKGDLVVKSPGVPMSHPTVHAAKAQGIPVIGEVDLAFEELVKQKKQVVGITGSNGKTTTTLFAAHLLRLAGKKGVVAGNIGIPLISRVEQEADLFIVELSSFQLESITPRAALKGAVLLNITPNHLDHHGSFEAYSKAKHRIRELLQPTAPLILGSELNKERVETILALSYRRREWYPHDVENMSAAAALTGVDDQILKEGIETFKKPPHRIERVGEIDGISFINDSKATNVDAVCKAVQAVPGSLILLAGGIDKGASYAPWIESFGTRVKHILAFGQAADRIFEDLSYSLSVSCKPDLESALKSATQLAKKGDTVLLSPGCSSLDQFESYEHRGERFRELVCGLRSLK